MSISFIYIIYRAFYRVYLFFKHWYVDGLLWWTNRIYGTLENLDKTFAVRVTLRNYFKPLYGDYTALGHILGLIFRTFRIFIGVTVYGLVLSIAFVVLIVWALLPAAIVYRIFSGPVV